MAALTITIKVMKRSLEKKAKNHDYKNDAEYDRGMQQAFNDMLTRTYNQSLVRQLKQDPNYQKAKFLCEQYDITSFNDRAKETEDFIRKYE